MAAVGWPDVNELKRILNVDIEDAVLQGHLEGLIDAAIIKVKADVGSWDEGTDTPDEQLAKAALRAAALMQVNAGDPAVVDTDAVYSGYLKNHRRVFGFA